MNRLLLVHPPATRPSEPPAGLARLAGVLRSSGIQVDVWDANLDGLLFLLRNGPTGSDTWTARARRDLPGHLEGLRSGATFTHPDTYRRVVGDLQRLLASSAAGGRGWSVSLTDCTHEQRPPTASGSLRAAAAAPEEDPFFPCFAPELERRLGAGGCTHLGLSVNYLGQALTAAAMAGWVRRRAPSVRIVMGGGLITSWMSRPGFIDPLPGVVDHLIAGPGEAALKRLLCLSPKGTAVASGGRHPRRGREFAAASPGEETPVLPTPSPLAPPPVYDLAGLSLAGYLSPGLVLPVSLADGCFWARCSFCPESVEQAAYRPLAPAEAVALLRTLASRERPSQIHLLDNALGPATLAALAGGPVGAPWYGFTRFLPVLADPDFGRALRASGCRMLQLGLESGDQGVLDALGKGISLDEAAAALRNLHACGIGTYVYLLFGTPVEGPENAARTLAFVAAHAEAIDFLNLAIFNLPIGAPEADSLETVPFSEGDLSLYLDFRHPRGWDRKAVRRFLELEFRRHPAVVPILRRDPPVFTSSHAPFFLPGWSFHDSAGGKS